MENAATLAVQVRVEFDEEVRTGLTSLLNNLTLARRRVKALRDEGRCGDERLVEADEFLGEASALAEGLAVRSRRRAR